MNTEDDEFARIEREQAMRGVPDAIHHTDTSETMEYIQGWNDCRAAMLAEQPAQQSAESGEPVAWCDLNSDGSIAYFDNRPCVMPGAVGNESHPYPLYTTPQPGTLCRVDSPEAALRMIGVL